MRHDVADATGSAQGRSTAGRVTIATPGWDAPDSMRHRLSGPMKAAQARLPTESACSIAPAASATQGRNVAARGLGTKARWSSAFLRSAVRGVFAATSPRREREIGQSSAEQIDTRSLAGGNRADVGGDACQDRLVDSFLRALPGDDFRAVARPRSSLRHPQRGLAAGQEFRQQLWHEMLL